MRAAFGRGLAGASQQRRPIAAPCGGARAVAGRQPVSCASSSKARELLQDCTGLGKVRFIVIGDGAILESVGTFTEPKYTDIPGRGTLATVSTPDKTFECHINITKLKEVRLAKSKPKQGDYDLYATRFVGEGDKVVLSMLLHGAPAGQYDPDAVAAWEAIRAKHGDVVVMAAA